MRFVCAPEILALGLASGIASGLAVGCGRHIPQRPGPIELVATPTGGKGAPYLTAFEAKQDGTQLLTTFLLRAERDGALRASDLAILISGHDGERLVTCRRDLVVGPEPAPPPPGTTYPRLLTKEVTDYVAECTTTPETVTHTVTVYKQEYNAATKTTFRFPEQKEVTETVNKKNCETVPKTHVASRYEHEIEASFIPPSLDSLRPSYTKLELHLGPPVCAAPATDKPANRIEGTIYRN